MSKHIFTCHLLALSTAIVVYAGHTFADTPADAMNPRAGLASVPLTAEGDAWLAHGAGPGEAVVVPYVKQPESVTLVRTGEAIDFTHAEETLRFTMPASALPDDVAAITFPENRWAKTMGWFRRQDAEAMPPEDAVLFVGSSSIRGWDLDKFFPGWVTVNRGFGGSEYGDMLRFADVLFKPYAPRAVVLYSGDNDIAAGKSAAWVVADFKALIARIRFDLPEIPIVVLGAKPSVARWELWPVMKQANEAMATHCADTEGLTYIDTAAPLLHEDGTPDPALFLADGLHLNDAGYAPWAALVKEAVGAADAQ